MHYGIFGQAAIKATEMLQHGGASTPKEAWDKAICEFTSNDSTRNKGCPRAVFLYLCQEGKISGVPRGEYTTGVKNGKYAIKALRLIKEDASWADNKTKLWTQVAGSDRSHNQQLDVLLALFDKGYIV